MNINVLLVRLKLSKEFWQPLFNTSCLLWIRLCTRVQGPLSSCSHSVEWGRAGMQKVWWWRLSQNFEWPLEPLYISQVSEVAKEKPPLGRALVTASYLVTKTPCLSGSLEKVTPSHRAVYDRASHRGSPGPRLLRLQHSQVALLSILYGLSTSCAPGSHGAYSSAQHLVLEYSHHAGVESFLQYSIVFWEDGASIYPYSVDQFHGLKCLLAKCVL